MYKFKDKAKNVQVANQYALAKTNSMFEWQNLPETIPHRELELMLQTHGYAFITKVEGELYAFTGGIGGETDVYGRPTQIVISNPALKFNKTLDLKKDGVLLHNDCMDMGLLPLFDKFNGQLAESDITLTIAGFNARIGTLISASDDKTKQSAELFLKRIADGEPAVIAEQAMLDGVKAHATSKNVEMTDLIEYHQYLKAGLANEIGLSASFNMKRERLNTAEVAQNDDTTYPFVDNMMACRLEGVAQLNAMYDLDLDVDYGSVWSSRRRDLVDDVVEPKPTMTEEVKPDGTSVQVPAVGTGEGGDQGAERVPGQEDSTQDSLIEDAAEAERLAREEDAAFDAAWDEAILMDAAFEAAKKEKEDEAQ